MLGLAAICLLPGANGQEPAAAAGVGSIEAQIKAARVVGQVTVMRAQGAAVALRNGDSLQAGDVVVTAKESSVVLVFSNGSTVSVAQDSKVAVDEFTQDPFAADVKLTELKEEPTTLHTKLNLTYGELVGNVKKLKGASTFEVQTPVGAAGIRGTTFRLVFRPAGNGKAFFTLSTASGTVIFQGITGAPIPVEENREVDIEAKIDEKTGVVTLVQVDAHGISPSAKRAIENALLDALDALDNMSFVIFQWSVSPKHHEPSQEPPQEPPRTTPGDGQAG